MKDKKIFTSGNKITFPEPTITFSHQYEQLIRDEIKKLILEEFEEFKNIILKNYKK